LSTADDDQMAIDVRGVEKTFRIPAHRVESLKERAMHPLSRGEFHELQALRDVSFQVARGEFFGIVGRNGCGKSTLLKILASIYSADAGRVRVNGTLAPFIELGVGFNPDLSARENVVLNGVMMGLTRREAEWRLGSVLEFAELEDFVELKLKNYSSGMMVRLAFSMMVQSDAEILLIDEVLAVGDAAFQQKCAEALFEMRRGGLTIVFVTHDMGAVQRFCHRALLLEKGEVLHAGDPTEVAERYAEVNSEHIAPEVLPGEDQFPLPLDPRPESDLEVPASQSPHLVDAWLDLANEPRPAIVAQGADVKVNAVFEGLEAVAEPQFAFIVTNTEGVDVFGFSAAPPVDADSSAEGVHVQAAFFNCLAPGTYVLRCWVLDADAPGQPVLEAPSALVFSVHGPVGGVGCVSLAREMSAVRIGSTR